MKRRQFIRNAILAAGALSLPAIDNSVFATTSESAKSIDSMHNGFKKSIMWGTVGMEGSVLDKCRAIKNAGYDGIEPDSHMDRNEVLKAMRETGLVASSVCCSTHWRKPLSDPDEAVRQEGVEGMFVALEDAHRYGTDAVLLVPGVVSESVSYDQCWERSTECIKQMIPMAEKLKVKICIENVWNNFLLSPMEAARFVDQFNSPYVRFYFDCGNILAYGWPEQWIKILGDRIGRIHIKEFSKSIADSTGKGNGFNVKLTEGEVNWVKVVEEAKKVYQGEWFTTEQGSSKNEAELKDLCQRLDRIVNL